MPVLSLQAVPQLMRPGTGALPASLLSPTRWQTRGNLFPPFFCHPFFCHSLFRLFSFLLAITEKSPVGSFGLPKKGKENKRMLLPYSRLLRFRS